MYIYSYLFIKDRRRFDRIFCGVLAWNFASFCCPSIERFFDRTTTESRPLGREIRGCRRQAGTVETVATSAGDSVANRSFFSAVWTRFCDSSVGNDHFSVIRTKIGPSVQEFGYSYIKNYNKISRLKFISSKLELCGLRPSISKCLNVFELQHRPILPYF